MWDLTTLSVQWTNNCISTHKLKETHIFGLAQCWCASQKTWLIVLPHLVSTTCYSDSLICVIHSYTSKRQHAIQPILRIILTPQLNCANVYRQTFNSLFELITSRLWHEDRSKVQEWGECLCQLSTLIIMHKEKIH